jgi:hypothetical protein
MKEIEVNIYSIVGNSFCVDSEDGEKVFELLKRILEQNNKAVISFLNVEMLTSAFLNTAVGRLYSLFSHEKIKASLSVKDISDDDKLLIKKVTDTAKAYYKNKEKAEKIENEILGV